MDLTVTSALINVHHSMETGSGADINEAVVAAMKDTGQFGKISAEIRAEVFHLLTKEMEHARSTPVCRENLLINELIREYLMFNGLSQTLSVFVPEAGQPADPMNREFIAHSLAVMPKQQTPLLNLLVRKIRERENVAPHPVVQKDPPPPPKAAPPPRPVVPEREESEDSCDFFEIRS